jgi:hypothetical protein
MPPRKARLIVSLSVDFVGNQTLHEQVWHIFAEPLQILAVILLHSPRDALGIHENRLFSQNL